MKKIIITLIVLSAIFSSCGNRTKNVNDATEVVDTVEVVDSTVVDTLAE
jgi:PBP1b-binding outer membrane lipoprotein LpoB